LFDINYKLCPSLVGAESVARIISIVVLGIIQALVVTFTKEEKHVFAIAFSFSNGRATTDIGDFLQLRGLEGAFAIAVLEYLLLLDLSKNSAILCAESLVHDLAVTVEDAGASDLRRGRRKEQFKAIMPCEGTPKIKESDAIVLSHIPLCCSCFHRPARCKSRYLIQERRQAR
jgi:hypothetical protein